MATKTIWVKNPQGVWVQNGLPSVRIATGYRPVTRISEKTGASTWTERWFRNVTPPAPPVTLTFAMSGSTMNVTAKAPADPDTVAIHYAWSSTGYPSAPPTTDGASSDIMSVGPNGTVTKAYGNQVTGRKWYWSAWTKDSAGNFSTAKLGTYTIPAIVTTPTTVNKTGYFYPVDGGSWNGQSNYWRTDNSYVYQGGYDWYGAWFYGTRISGALARAKSVTKMQIAITRVNSVHGVPGEAKVYLSPHWMAAQPTGSPDALHHTGIYVGTLGRGETGTFTVPSAWYANFATRKYTGFGLYVGSTSFSDDRYLYAHPTASHYGRVYIEWTE